MIDRREVVLEYQRWVSKLLGFDFESLTPQIGWLMPFLYRPYVNQP